MNTGTAQQGICRRGRVAAFSLTMALFSTGCQWPQVWPVAIGSTSTPRESAPSPANARASTSSRSASPSDTLHIVHLAFEVLRAEMPIEGALNSRKVWNHVDELRVGAEVSAQLARNGLRVGVGGPGSWPAIAAILEACRAKRSRDQLLAQAGSPLLIELADITDSEAVFAYGADKRLTGKTFEAGSKVIQLDYAFHPHLNGATDLQAKFEIRRERGELTWARQVDGSIRQAPAIDRHVFEGIAAQAAVNAGEFLVIGPSEHAENEYIVGSRFLTRRGRPTEEEGRSGERYETLLFITPQPFQSASVRERR